MDCLNKELPKPLHILFRSLDVRQLHKSNQECLHGRLEALANWTVSSLGYFFAVEVCGASSLRRPLSVQVGVVRMNCVDCLDRTNYAQLFVGAAVLAHHLHATRFIAEPVLGFDTQVFSVLSELYELLGDHFSLQYGGSITHKKFTAERPRMMKHSKELLTSITRHYTNSFADSEKQHATNILLGLAEPSVHGVSPLDNGQRSCCTPASAAVA